MGFTIPIYSDFFIPNNDSIIKCEYCGREYHSLKDSINCIGCGALVKIKQNTKRIIPHVPKEDREQIYV
jgi:DNA-directed RNA polymerase subunit RPC12/RpoP